MILRKKNFKYQEKEEKENLPTHFHSFYARNPTRGLSNSVQPLTPFSMPRTRRGVKYFRKQAFKFQAQGGRFNLAF